MSLALNTFRTPLGWCAMVGDGDTLHALTFGHRSAGAAIQWLDEIFPVSPAASAARASWNRTLANRIVAMFEGEPDEFRDVKIDLSHLTPFGRRVISLCRKIGWGETRSYGQLASKAGSSGAARAVGSVMAANRTPLIVPCHRVIGSAGALGGYSGPSGLTTKRKLLALEGDCACC
ncbi:MAG: methylated-DNA--[protein]-cysteine S-methyltransferase [Pirellulales bacterium]|nr:methylated-DNA--[protein]-cysteine S-methyltransferase [Pirellulales bacterium]